MPFARVFQSGNSQAVRLPREFRLDVDRVEIFRQGNDLVLRQIPANAGTIFDALSCLPMDILDHARDDTPPQEREAF